MLVDSINFTANGPLVSAEHVNDIMKNSVSEKQKHIVKATDAKLVKTNKNPLFWRVFCGKKATKSTNPCLLLKNNKK
jgi:hypothetical protein